ncbi:RING-type E3 ubiquitin transferase makorin-1 [Hyphodiscus hymeniophilus]|uniref:RING-type E3 ubiquitin transferase makorin-1 n=1 Tax=Hyphodiscus hymeniophilus TaxID=353542 RepID=A0A9P6VT30_9HELO|nr:RING-type E3 ubiquitin transferase makorin-1 [Hyphodiscus hymeniophilus]
MSLDIPPERILPPAEIDCKWWKQGYCSRGKKCWFRHDEAMAGADNEPCGAGAANASSSPQNDEGASSSNNAPSPTQICTICFENPHTFGLLLNCDHVFCLECLRIWRASTNLPQPLNDELRDATKTCPLCRAHSDFIIPSSQFPVASSTEPAQAGENTAKREIVDRYLRRLGNIPCRYFEKSVKNVAEAMHNFRPKCKFGNDCHYAHKHPVTKEPYIFSEAELKIRRRKPRERGLEYSAEDMAIMEEIFNAFGVDGYESDELGCDDDDLTFFEEGSVGFGFGLDMEFEEFDDFGWE